MGKHPCEVDLLYPFFAQQVPEQYVLGPRVEAVGIEVEALCSLIFLDDTVSSTNDLILGRRHFIVAVGRPFDQLDFMLFGLLRLIQIIELAEQARDYLVVQQFVEFVGHRYKLVRALLGRI